MTTKRWCPFQSLCAVCAKGPIVSQYAHTVSPFYILSLKLKDGLTLPCSFLHRIDVTEVQIAIIIMYLMSAFGGVALWQTTVTENVIFLYSHMYR